MFSKRTLFIVGAGCSAPFGFPLGYKLREDIYKIVSQEISTLYHSSIGEAFQIYASGRDALKACERARLILQLGVYSRPSIDQFLHYNRDEPDVVTLGKLIIAETIRSYERTSPLKNNAQTRGDWLERVFHIASEDTTPDNIEGMFSNLRIIVFNYDRCIEQYFYAQTLGLVKRSNALAKRICSHLNIVHAYGCIGPAPWAAEYTRTVEFGSEPLKGHLLLNAAQGIELFTERTEPHAASNAARFELLQAEVMAICGFGFIKQNIEFLRVEEELDIPMFVNMCGVPEEDHPEVYGNLHGMCGKPPFGLRRFHKYEVEAREFLRRAGGSLQRGL